MFFLLLKDVDGVWRLRRGEMMKLGLPWLIWKLGLRGRFASCQKDHESKGISHDLKGFFDSFCLEVG